LASKKSLVVILTVVIVVLTVLDYQLYHRGVMTPWGGFGFQFTTPFTPEITTPVSTSISQREQPKSFATSNPSTSISLTYASSSTNNQPEPVPRVGIYSNNPLNNTPQPLDAIDWSASGSITPGQKVNSPRIYLRNEGTAAITLTFSTSSWSFEDIEGRPLPGNRSAYFVLTWDYDNSSIAVNETRPITFSLSISPNISDVSTFSFDLSITSIE
jgi:hypothetical protein